ncbi:MAG: hypothetical protein IJJ41_08310 [Clostridia bacterium]|nr:hypothetical protein [Clostridia bacterium]
MVSNQVTTAGNWRRPFTDLIVRCVMLDEYYTFRSNLAQRTAAMRDGYYTPGTHLAAGGQRR